MPRFKQPQKKQKRGVDFAKIKRKIGRKLPPPKNTTDTTVKSKAIVLPEQSVASEKAGLAVSGKGLTLKELLQQTSHHNAKIRRDALNGVKDLVLKYPSELKLHKLVVIEKLRQRIMDDDKTIRETLYHLLNSVIFPTLKEDVPAPAISSLMAYVYSAMANVAIDIRIMAFKFFDLIVNQYPSSFFLYAEQVLQYYEEMLQNNQIYLMDKSKLKTVLNGLVRCLSLLASDQKNTTTEQAITLHAFESDLPEEHPGDSRIVRKVEGLIPTVINCFQEIATSVRTMTTLENNLHECMLYALESVNLAVKVYARRRNDLSAIFEGPSPLCEETDSLVRCQNSLPYLLKKLFDMFPLQLSSQMTRKEDHKYVALNLGITEVYLHLDELFGVPSVVMDKFLMYIQEYFSEQMLASMRGNKVLIEKLSTSLLLYIPKLVLKVDTNWRFHLMESFTRAFRGIKPESILTLTFLSAIEAMLIPDERQELWLFEEIIAYQITWVKELSQLLLNMGDRHASISKVVLHILMRVGQSISESSPLFNEYDKVQHHLSMFYHSCTDDGSTSYSTFVMLSRDCQELAICCLYYFSNLDPLLLRSLAACCLYKDLDSYILCRIIEVVHCTFRAGRVHIENYISFMVTLLISFRVLPESSHFLKKDHSVVSNRANYNALTNTVCSSLSQIGDSSLLLRMVHKVTFSYMSSKAHLDNIRGILKLFAILDPSLSRLPAESISELSFYLCTYLIDAASFVPEDDKEPAYPDQICIFQYYFEYALILLRRCKKLLGLLLDAMGSTISEVDSMFVPDREKESLSEQLSRVQAISSIIRFLHEDVQLHHNLSLFKTTIKHILQITHNFQAKNECDTSLFKRHKLRCSLNQLITQTGGVHLWNNNDFEQIST